MGIPSENKRCNRICKTDIFVLRRQSDNISGRRGIVAGIYHLAELFQPIGENNCPNCSNRIELRD